jgi:cysteine desulfurase
MPQLPIYMDNHATTRVDPRVLEAMVPYFTDHFGNAASTSHSHGWDAKAAVDQARESIAHAIHASPREIVFTSGATESNNLAIRGVTDRHRRRGNHIVSVTTEHKAVLDPLAKLARKGFDVRALPVVQHGASDAGRVDIDQLQDSLRDNTCLVSVMLANNEIGVIQPIAEIGHLCRERGIPFHCDATQAVGKMPVDVEALNIDLMSFTAHKIYGPKGIGALYVRRQPPQVRLEPQIDGGGHESGIRSGTLNVPGIVGFAKALEVCLAELDSERDRLARLRFRLFRQLGDSVADMVLNGPAFDGDKAAGSRLRLPGNLNCTFANVDGEALMMSMRDVALSSGAACTSTNPEPSHVLRALGLSDDLTRASLRFGLGRFNTEDEVDFTANAVAEAVTRLRSLTST